MIAKSDIVILLVATTALGVSVLRWSAVQTDTPRATTATAPPSSSAPANVGAPVPSVSLDNPVGSAGNQPIDQAPGTNGASSAGNASTASDSTTNATSGSGSNATPEQADTADTADTAGGNGTGIHTVVSGDSLGVIANRYNTSVLELQVINGIEGTTIFVGQELRYPLASN